MLVGDLGEVDSVDYCNIITKYGPGQVSYCLTGIEVVIEFQDGPLPCIHF
jgi:hypothetical protein